MLFHTHKDDLKNTDPFSLGWLGMAAPAPKGRSTGLIPLCSLRFDETGCLEGGTWTDLQEYLLSGSQQLPVEVRSELITNSSKFANMAKFDFRIKLLDWNVTTLLFSL